MITLYGLGTCDSCRQARAWLDAQGRSFHFHDWRRDGLEESLLRSLETVVGWESLLNRRSATWRGLAAAERAGLNQERALDLMLRHPALIKRPLLVAGERILLGFSPADYAELP